MTLAVTNAISHSKHLSTGFKLARLCQLLVYCCAPSARQKTQFNQSDSCVIIWYYIIHYTSQWLGL